MPEMEQSKKMVNQDKVLRQRIVNANEQLRKQRRDNREKEMTQVMFQCLTGRDVKNFGIVDLNNMGWLIEQHLKDIEKKIETYHMTVGGSSSSSTAATLLLIALQLAPTLDLGGGRNVGESSQATNHHQQQQWFRELMNPQDQQQPMVSGVEDMVLPFGDTNHNPLWSSSFFPY